MASPKSFLGNLFKRRCSVDNLCPICEKEVETTEHLFFLCPWAKMVWFGCNIKPLGDLGGNGSVIKWVADMMENLTVKEVINLMGRVALIAWNIWKSRNDFVFNKTKVNPQHTITSFLHAEMEFLKAFEIPKVQMDNPPNQEDLSTWRAPDKGRFKANCDAAIPASGLRSIAAVVLRNWKGKIVDGLAKSVHVRTSLGGELHAIRAACEMLISLDLKEVEVESDSQQAIHLSVSELVPPWDVKTLVMDIRHFAKEGNLLFKWVRRVANRMAHKVAFLASRNSLPCN
ncbi:uncharacterized protein LOC131299867 [Rhododendron vialii]|uniref:uncharacterized protein LOC131299867 n=1 Tax=Rhododendron vialii TaxID=182163 RepID=UPI0026601315|nr:uncharacterized protein LOC131299867 [Rhododendron vialii]